MSRSPDYVVKALLDDGSQSEVTVKGRVGAAWKNEDGSISIKLDNFIVLQGNPKLYITLFENEDKTKTRK